jgi:hypothetical protein
MAASRLEHYSAAHLIQLPLAMHLVKRGPPSLTAKQAATVNVIDNAVSSCVVKANSRQLEYAGNFGILWERTCGAGMRWGQIKVSNGAKSEYRNQTDLRKDGTKSLDSLSIPYSIPILCDEDQMDMKLEDTVPTASHLTIA